MATTYLSAAAAAAAAANYHHYEQDSASATAAAAVAMNLVNTPGGASGGYCSPRDSMKDFLRSSLQTPAQSVCTVFSFRLCVESYEKEKTVATITRS